MWNDPVKVLGISGSPRPNANTAGLVKAVLAGCNVSTQFITLAGLRIEPCKSCLGCKDTNECVIDDDHSVLRKELLNANALVIGAPNYHNMINGLMHCFLERFYQFRHRERNLLAGKLGVAVGVGGSKAEPVIQQILAFFQFYRIESVGSVSAQGVARCFDCGYGEWCRSGAIIKAWGADQDLAKIRPSLDKQPDSLKEAFELGKRISARLKEKAHGDQCHQSWRRNPKCQV